MTNSINSIIIPTLNFAIPPFAKRSISSENRQLKTIRRDTASTLCCALFL